MPTILPKMASHLTLIPLFAQYGNIKFWTGQNQEKYFIVELNGSKKRLEWVYYDLSGTDSDRSYGIWNLKINGVSQNTSVDPTEIIPFLKGEKSDLEDFLPKNQIAMTKGPKDNLFLIDFLANIEEKKNSFFSSVGRTLIIKMDLSNLSITLSRRSNTEIVTLSFKQKRIPNKVVPFTYDTFWKYYLSKESNGSRGSKQSGHIERHHADSFKRKNDNLTLLCKLFDELYGEEERRKIQELF